MKQLGTWLGAPAAIALSVCLCGAPVARGQAPDNSQQNKGQTTTAQSQSSASSDRQTTANVRKAIIADKNLSMYAHNVKIITRGGQVTLKGPVKSEEEKQQVATDAAGVVSADKVNNQLTVKQ
jgi:osmotically-inducible protein OsmY